MAGPGVAQLVGDSVGTLGLGVKLAYNINKNMESIKTSWNSMIGDDLPEGMQGRWMKQMSYTDVVCGGVLSAITLGFAGLEIWQAVKTKEQKNTCLAQLAKSR